MNTKKALEMIEELKADGYDNKQIADFLEDGEAMAVLGYANADVVELAHDFIKK